MDDGERDKRFRCVTGHEIDESDLEACTELEVLDGGAEVRLCREHGAPIAVQIAPPSRGAC